MTCPTHPAAELSPHPRAFSTPHFPTTLTSAQALGLGCLCRPWLRFPGYQRAEFLPFGPMSGPQHRVCPVAVWPAPSHWDAVEVPGPSFNLAHRTCPANPCSVKQHTTYTSLGASTTGSQKFRVTHSCSSQLHCHWIARCLAYSVMHCRGFSIFCKSKHILGNLSAGLNSAPFRHHVCGHWHRHPAATVCCVPRRWWREAQNTAEQGQVFPQTGQSLWTRKRIKMFLTDRKPKRTRRPGTCRGGRGDVRWRLAGRTHVSTSELQCNSCCFQSLESCPSGWVRARG